MTDIRDWRQHIEGVWDHQELLAGCFGTTKIRPTDCDGMIERAGHFVIIETKKLGAILPLGQLLTFRAARRRHFADLILVLYGPRNEVKRIQIIEADESRDRWIDPATNDHYRSLISDWFAAVEDGRRLA